MWTPPASGTNAKRPLTKLAEAGDRLASAMRAVLTAGDGGGAVGLAGGRLPQAASSKVPAAVIR